MNKLVETDLLERTADEIRADKQAWLDRKARNKQKSDDAYKAYRTAQLNQFQPIKDYIEKLLSKYNLLDINVYVDRNWGDAIEVRVQCAENSRSEATSLRWDYKATLMSNGELKKETGSWSGLQACTIDQIENLKQCVGALEDLNNIDWKSLLSVTPINWDDYYNYEKEDETPEYDYDTELKLELLRDILGQDKAIEFVHPKLEQLFWTWRLNTYFLKVTKLTPKNVKGLIYVKEKDGSLRNTSAYEENFSLDKLTLKDNIENID